ncbi:MAG: IS200/IS605 family transposase [Pyrinomonadaceae bacterium]
MKRMSDGVYSEINFHITWHTKNSLPMIGEKVEERLYRYLTHKIIETAGAFFHAIGGTSHHVHVAVSLLPNILVSDWVGRLKGSSAYYINHEVQPKGLQWQRGYGIVTFGTRDLPWVIGYVKESERTSSEGFHPRAAGNCEQ